MSATSVGYEGLPFVNGALNYLAPMSERPRYLAYDPPDGVQRSNMTSVTHVRPIYSTRPIQETISLDREGFAVLPHKSVVRDFYDADEVKRVYYKEAEALLAETLGAKRVFIFDHTVRRRVPNTDDRAPGQPRQPATRVHVDHTAQSGPQRVRDFLGAEGEELLRGRMQIINLWRPIRGPLYDTPLAVCDARSVASGDLVASDLVYRDRVGETYSVRFNPDHRWFYVPQMQADEVLLLKCCDTKTDGRAQFAPHTAFVDPTTPSDAPPRESIELRTFVFH